MTRLAPLFEPLLEKAKALAGERKVHLAAVWRRKRAAVPNGERRHPHDGAAEDGRLAVRAMRAVTNRAQARKRTSSTAK
ncbi:hypothetical protein B1690_02385 [Geobacillus sp. 46C-IIa]|nr:hypothetical protein B1690_02385 [Geobacillus sp. 46C-IIa]